ncbi:23S rRNA (uracil(1939)-C(5))-methyltransferase RlmD [Colwelliaceae bacterium BS250]
MVNFYKPTTKKNNLQQVFTIDIQRLDINGDGVSRVQKKPVFVSGALVNETVEVKVIEEKSKYLRAKVLNIVTASEQRAKPKCKHFYQCGGCDLQHSSISGQLEYKKHKVEELFRRNANINDLPWQESLTTSEWHYRRKARIGVQYNKLGEAIVGFRQKNSNVLTKISSCSVLDSTFSDEFVAFTEVINSLSAVKAISHIEVIAADNPQVIFRHTRPLNKKDVQLLTEFIATKNYQLLLQDDQQVRCLDGSASDLLSYQVADCTLKFSSNDFVQINAKLNEKMVHQACQWLDLKTDDNVLDLFCGLGNFSLPIAKQVNSVVGVEGVDTMVQRANDNSAINQLVNCQFYQADLNAEQANWPWLDNSINKVLLDPARAGALNAVKNISEQKIKTILYVSCDPATMARDAEVLLSKGYKLDKIALLDMFAQTRHVETMALFTL